MPLRLVVDGRWLQQPMHGIARYTLELLRHLPLEPRDQVFVLYRSQDFSPRDFAGAQGPLPLHWIEVKSPLFSWKEAREFPALMDQLRPHVVHFPGFWHSSTFKTPWVMTLHDLIHLQGDVSWKYAAYYHLLKRRLPQAAAVFTVSHASARTLTAWAPEVKSKLKVTYLGLPELATMPPTERPDTPYFLYVGNAKPHKNTALLFVAMEQLYQQLQRRGISLRPPLITVGLPAPTPLPAWHRPLQGISDQQLYALYAQATAVLMPSFEEGCGLPLLEAMAHQRPILASDIAVFREILNGSGVCLDPRQPSVWARAMAAFFLPEDPFLETLLATQQRQIQNRQRFSWSHLAQETYQCYQEVAQHA